MFSAIGTARLHIQGGRPLSADHLIDKFARELIKNGRHGRMRSEHATLPDGFNIRLGRGSQVAVPHSLFQQGERQKSRVTFVQMVILDTGVTQARQHFDAAHPHGGFLTKAVGLIAAVQIIGERTICGIVFRQIGVEQINRYGLGNACKCIARPGSGRDVSPTPETPGRPAARAFLPASTRTVLPADSLARRGAAGSSLSGRPA
jgi:hypothetical protein